MCIKINYCRLTTTTTNDKLFLLFCLSKTMLSKSEKDVNQDLKNENSDKMVF